MKVLPITKLGKWSTFLLHVFVLMMLFIFALGHLFHQHEGEYFFSNLLLSIPILLAFASGIAAFITGVISFFASKERGLAVLLSSLAGLLVIVYGVIEFSPLFKF